ncbi:D-alanine--D-alanine ligase [Psychrosphaera sp. B3R10]|uniref:D-alanine--D-alanine ligase n=1 Tax=unclassified Psychrosphaera TaxID=2641570 RepID=UPI001C080DE8|nr:MULTISPECIES: D-alanine--D-alanine ligase [unclassified Psychrosphaera]MBU2880454.1 D-alanine--D-alanine ligase [Psychrosphaera sp. I2R16]MBU2991445.1 D-alanine--D-alanine ligase [Psychrosphaera sp. B3R10]MDO6720326.1 D-alanine--D-alanine ligase [Psychrosphaera sp. 1_MG-2023]
MSSTLSQQFGKVAVMFGGKSAEREVSLNSGQAVLNALVSQGIDAHKFDPKDQPITDLIAGEFDRVFIVLHGRGGEDGSLQGALDLFGIPYTGSGQQGSALAMDKVRSKYLFVGANLSTAPFAVATEGKPFDAEAIMKSLGDKVMVKPANEGSSIGMSQANSAEELEKALENAYQYDHEVLIEQWITGQEVTVSILNGEALPIIEMRTPHQFYDYDAKYKSDSTVYLCPAPLAQELTDKIKHLAVEAFALLGCKGWGRVDLLIDANEQPKLLEVNTVPGMTTTSLVPKAAKAEGISFEQLVVNILRGTLA